MSSSCSEGIRTNRQVSPVGDHATSLYIPSPNESNMVEPRRHSIHFTVALRHLGVIHDDSDLGWSNGSTSALPTRGPQSIGIWVTDIYLLIFWQRSRAMHLHVLVNIACLCIRTALSPGFVELSLNFMGLDLPASTRPLQKMLRLVKFLLHLQCFSSRAIRNCFDTSTPKNSVHARLLLLWLLGLRNNFHLNKLHKFGISQPLTLTRCWRLTLIVRIGLLGRLQNRKCRPRTKELNHGKCKAVHKAVEKIIPLKRQMKLTVSGYCHQWWDSL